MRFFAFTILFFAWQTQVFAMGAKPAGKLMAEPSGRVQMAGDFTEDEQKTLVADFTYLQQQTISDDANLAELLHLNHVDVAGLMSWLAERVQYIVGTQKDAPGASTESTVVMSNLGASLFYQAKKANAPVSFVVPNGPLLTITTPRVGLIEAGNGLFRGPFASESMNASSNASRISRIATLFHEARHSDGNGSSLAFFHASCPTGHIYENQPACDHNLNGPYTIGGNLILSLVKSCQNCSEQEKELLKLDALDSFSRVIRDTVEVMQADECTYVQTIPNNDQVPQTIVDQCKMNSRKTSTISGVSSSIWDDSPEYLNHS